MLYLASLERYLLVVKPLIHGMVYCYSRRYATKYQVTYENRRLPTNYADWTGRQAGL